MDTTNHWIKTTCYEVYAKHYIVKFHSYLSQKISQMIMVLHSNIHTTVKPRKTEKQDK
jgi:hypothetical protein